MTHILEFPSEEELKIIIVEDSNKNFGECLKWDK